jgi:acylglycerol lipase
MTMLANAYEEKIESTKGLRIFVRSWMPPSTPRAVVVVCHGVNSHSGQYLWVGEQLAGAGYAAFALDLRGRGQSEGERFFVEDIADGGCARNFRQSLSRC